jgi:hypothetical protein
MVVMFINTNNRKQLRLGHIRSASRGEHSRCTSLLNAAITLSLLTLISLAGCGEDNLLSPQTAGLGDEPGTQLALIEFGDESRIEILAIDGLILVSAEGDPNSEAFRNGIDGREELDPVVMYESIVGRPAPEALTRAVGRQSLLKAGEALPAVPAGATDPSSPWALASSSGSCTSSSFARDFCKLGYDFNFCFPSVSHDYRREEEAWFARAIVQPYAGRVTMILEYKWKGRWYTTTMRDVATCTPYTSYISVIAETGSFRSIPIRVKVEWDEGERYGIWYGGAR